MIEGTLQINLDPPYIAFSELPKESLDPAAKMTIVRPSSVEEIRELLLELGAITPDQAWPPRECILRFPVALSRANLRRFNLLQLHALETSDPGDEPTLRLIS
ncbi:MAG: hypothetical protein JST01_19395 [Cyanobacteria bacterium SZAS TMP-1]|nr:hypothetical protein [Cyanobacteria bacterium SZAS TMP-1]